MPGDITPFYLPINPVKHRPRPGWRISVVYELSWDCPGGLGCNIEYSMVQYRQVKYSIMYEIMQYNLDCLLPAHPTSKITPKQIYLCNEGAAPV